MQPTIRVWDARTCSSRQLGERLPQLLRELKSTESTQFDRMPWLRAILLVAPLPSDALALSVMKLGIVVLEAPPEDPAVKLIAQFVHQADPFQGIATSRAYAASHNPTSLPTHPGGIDAESEFSRSPAYLNQELYTEWLRKLSQPWRKEDAVDSEF